MAELSARWPTGGGKCFRMETTCMRPTRGYQVVVTEKRGGPLGHFLPRRVVDSLDRLLTNTGLTQGETDRAGYFGLECVGLSSDAEMTQTVYYHKGGEGKRGKRRKGKHPQAAAIVTTTSHCDKAYADILGSLPSSCSTGSCVVRVDARVPVGTVAGLNQPKLRIVRKGGK